MGPLDGAESSGHGSLTIGDSAVIHPFPPCPQPPDWRVDWETLDATFPWVRNLRGCPQDPIRHAEGDVWTHVRMVCEAMAGLEAWRALPELERKLLFTAALLHDVAKPACLAH